MQDPQGCRNSVKLEHVYTFIIDFPVQIHLWVLSIDREPLSLSVLFSRNARWVFTVNGEVTVTLLCPVEKKGFKTLWYLH